MGQDEGHQRFKKINGLNWACREIVRWKKIM